MHRVTVRVISIATEVQVKKLGSELLVGVVVSGSRHRQEDSRVAC